MGSWWFDWYFSQLPKLPELTFQLRALIDDDDAAAELQQVAGVWDLRRQLEWWLVIAMAMVEGGRGWSSMNDEMPVIGGLMDHMVEFLLASERESQLNCAFDKIKKYLEKTLYYRNKYLVSCMLFPM